MIEHISDTARWVATYRAMETERPDAIFRDPFARKLAGARGQEIVDNMHQGRRFGWAFVVRTAVFDRVILDTIAAHSIDLVLNLAAGLDARAWRLPVSPTLRWIDADLPGILDYKTDLLKSETPKCRYEAVRVDLTGEAARRALFARASSEAKNVLVVTEGLLIYLTDQQVGSLARDLHAQPNFGHWVFDLAHPELLKMMNNTWGKAMEEAQAPFLFAPASSTKFFEPFGWREEAFYSTMEEARNLRREMRFSWFYRILGAFASRERKEIFRRFSGYALMRRV